MDNFSFIFPISFLIGFLCLSILTLPIGKNGKDFAHYLNLIGIVGFILLINRDSHFLLTNLFVLNSYKIKFLSVVSAFGIIICLLNGQKEVRDVKVSILSTFMLIGSVFLIGSTEFMTFFVALEVISLMNYSQVALSRLENAKEASIKYFIQGSIFSAVFLLGVAFFVGATGGFNFVEFTVKNQVLYMTGVSLIFLVCCFKMGAFPFHAWMPDVYSNVDRGNLASNFLITKLVVGYGFIQLLIKLVNSADPSLQQYIVTGILVISVVSAFYGNIVGLAQFQFKRIVAFSSLAHAGYMLMTLCLNLNEGYESQLMFYLTFYSVSATGTILLINQLLAKGTIKDSYDSLKGGFYRDGVSSTLLVIFILSLAGIPLTSGFATKYLLFSNYFREGFTIEATCVLISSIIGLAFYIRFIVALFMEEQEVPPLSYDMSGAAVLHTVDIRDRIIHILLAALVIIGGVAPSLFLN